MTEGLTTVNYDVVEYEKKELFTWLLVDVNGKYNSNNRLNFKMFINYSTV